MTQFKYPHAVLFDLDGTLLDTAPDYQAVLNIFMAKEKRPEIPLSDIRTYVSQGMDSVMKNVFKLNVDHKDYSPIMKQLLHHYGQVLGDYTGFFPGMSDVLDYLADHNIPWGIITNKHSEFTDPLLTKMLPRMNLKSLPMSVVSGNTTTHAKPHPTPLFYACEQIGVDPKACVYIGDHERDIVAGRAAGMKTIGALFGYLAPTDTPDTWKADAYVHHSLDILPLLKKWL